MDKVKIALAVACVVAGVAGYYYFAETAQVLRVLMVLGGLLLSAWTRAQSGFKRRKSSGFKTRSIEEILAEFTAS